MPSESPVPPQDPGTDELHAASVLKASRKPIAAFLALALGAVAVIGFIAFATSAGAANLRFAFTAGETHRYALSITMDFRGGNLQGGGAFVGGIETVMRQRTISVDEDGVATIEYGFESMKLTEGGSARTIPVPGDVTTIKMGPDGAVLEVDGPGLEALENINPAAGLIRPEIFGPQLPDSEVEPGDSWKIDERFPNDLGEAFHVTGTGSLVEKGRIGSEEAAVIRTEIASPLNFGFDLGELGAERGLSLAIPRDASIRFDGFVSMDLTQSMGTGSGRLISALGEIKMTGTFVFVNVPELPSLSGVMNLTMQITMTALP